MGKGISVSPENIEKMREMYARGVSQGQIAKEFDVHVNTVQRHVKDTPRVNVPKTEKRHSAPQVAKHEPASKPKFTNDDLLRLRKAGLNDSEIAKTVGCSPSTVSNRIGKRDPEEIKADRLAGLGKAHDARRGRKSEESEKPAQTPVETPVAVEEPTVEEQPPVAAEPVVAPPSDSTFKVAAITTDTMSEFAVLANWIDKVYELADIAQDEPWRYINPGRERKYPDVAILLTYIGSVFRRRVASYNAAKSQKEADDAIFVRRGFCCIHTGLYTPSYSGIYMYFVPNTYKGYNQPWVFTGFRREADIELRKVQPLPKHIQPITEKKPFHADWPIRINADHILTDETNKARLPESIRDAWNLPLLLETAVELSRRKALIEPGLVVQTAYKDSINYYVPLFLTSGDHPDLAMALEEEEGYYACRTCLTLEMAYAHARDLGRPTVKWLTDLVTW